MQNIPNIVNKNIEEINLGKDIVLLFNLNIMYMLYFTVYYVWIKFHPLMDNAEVKKFP